MPYLIKRLLKSCDTTRYNERAPFLVHFQGVKKRIVSASKPFYKAERGERIWMGTLPRKSPKFAQNWSKQTQVSA
jgi:hypothetical protein